MPYYPPPSSGGIQTQIDAASAAAGDYLVREKLAADAQYRLIAGLDGSSNPQVLMGSGTATDLRLWRSSSNPTLQIDTNGVDTNLYLSAVGNGASGGADVLIGGTGTGLPFVELGAYNGTTGGAAINLAGGSAADTSMGGALIALRDRSGDAAYSVLISSAIDNTPGHPGLALGSTSAQDIRLYRSAAAMLVLDSNGQAQSTSLYLNAVNSSYYAALYIQQVGDASPRFGIWAGGGYSPTVAFGPGNAAQDVRLYRSSTKTLTLDANGGTSPEFDVVGTGSAASAVIAIKAGSSNTGKLGLMRAGEGQYRVSLIDSGMSLGDGTVLDTRLYRSAAKVLTVDDNAAGAVTLNVVGTIQQNGNALGAASIEFVIDGGGSTITTGLKGWLEVPFPCTIQSATMYADASGSIVVDVWKTTYANWNPGTHPVAGDKITASAPPTISTTYKSTDSTLTGWTKTLALGDVLAFNVNSVTTIQRVTIVLDVLRT